MPQGLDTGNQDATLCCRQPFLNECAEPASWQPLATLPSRQGARVDTEFAGQPLLRPAANGPVGSQTLRHAVLGPERDVAQERHNRRQEAKGRVRVVQLPVRDGGCVCTNSGGDLAL